jgi:hypothetical protein
MPWSKFDDSFHEHHKTVAMSDKAFRLFVTSVTYSSRHSLRGRLSPSHLAVLYKLTGATPKHAEELITLRSYDRDGDDVLIHDFENYNPDREEISKKRSEAGKLGAEKKWAEHKKIANAIDLPLANGLANDSSRGGSPDPVPLPKNQNRIDSGIDSESASSAIVEWQNRNQRLAEYSADQLGDSSESIGYHIRVWNHSRKHDRGRQPQELTDEVFSIVGRLADTRHRTGEPQGRAFTRQTKKLFLDWGDPLPEKIEVIDPAEAALIRAALLAEVSRTAFPTGGPAP